MTTEDALLAAINAAPDDDLPRLVFADWLDERNGPGDAERSEFIRVQIELAKWPGPIPANGKQKSREAKLWEDAIYNKGVFRWFDWRRDDEFAWHMNAKGLCELWKGRDGSTAAKIVIRRGFPGVVHGPLAVLVGGVCGRCGGEGSLLPRAFPGLGDCPACHGTGTTPGVLTDLCKRFPIQRVEVTNREPLRFTPDGGSSSTDWPDRFSWGRLGGLSLTGGHWLPDDLWALIPCQDVRGERYKRFDTEELARAALSAALIAWAKSHAAEQEPAR